MPLLCGKLIAAILVTTVAGAVAMALGTVMALVSEADQRARRDREAAA